jgi:hypothetical protein
VFQQPLPQLASPAQAPPDSMLDGEIHTEHSRTSLLVPGYVQELAHLLLQSVTGGVHFLFVHRLSHSKGHPLGRHHLVQLLDILQDRFGVAPTYLNAVIVNMHTDLCTGDGLPQPEEAR